MSVMLHPRTGNLIVLSNGNRTAQRNQPFQEFNNGLVMSLEPLKDNQLFEVRIDKKINSWTGSIEIGVTTCDPCSLEFPSSAADLREQSWVMSGNSVLKDGQPTVEEYGQNLDTLEEGDRLGVMRTSQGDLHFFINGINQGVATTNIPSRIYAVVDLYGKCVQVTVLENTTEARLLANEINNESTLASNFAHLTTSPSNNTTVTTAAAVTVVANNNNNNNNNSTSIDNCSGGTNIANSSTVGGNYNGTPSRLHFHERTGSLVKLSNNCRTAERRRPFDEFNNGVIMTHRPLFDDELFEIRIDRLVDKWSGSIEVGITTHNPALLQFPATMTNMRSGTIMMSGCGILTNGKGTRREYGEYNLDELTEGDRIGLIRKANGNLHYYINGIDQGIAATKVPSRVFGVVDLYGMTVEVTIVDRDDRVEQGLANHRNNTMIRECQLLNAAAASTTASSSDAAREPISTDKLLFHPHCGIHAEVLNNGRIAHRPMAVDDFDNAVVLTNRPLKPNEMFEIRLDMMLGKWAGSLEIGVTTHSPLELDFPSTMTNIRSGTWMMTGNGFMHNGTIIIEDYGANLDSFRVGDRVGVMRTDTGNLHFYVNGIDLSAAATNVPDKVYGVIDLYGQAAQCTIIDHSETSEPPNVSCGASNTTDLRFHYLHGRHACITNGGLTASRPNAEGEFNDAIVISNRPLHDGEMFEVILDKMVDRWSGSIEAGVTAIKPDDLEFPSTMTDIDYDTWMLSGSAIMQDGSTIRNGYKCDLDSLGANTRVGMMRCVDGTLHYFINGEDMGVACQEIPSSVYAVIDLYGQCAQVTIIPPSSCLSESSISPPTHTETLRPSVVEGTDVLHCFSPCCGKNITLSNNNLTATRIRGFNNGLVLSSVPLQSNEMFEIQVDKVSYQWSGSLGIGLTTLQIPESYALATLPTRATLLNDSGDTWLISGTQVRKNGKIIKDNYGFSLDHLDAGDRLGIKRGSDGTMHVYQNGESLGVAASDLPKRVYALVDLYGAVEKVTVVSKELSSTTPDEMPKERRMSLQSNHSRDSLEDAEVVSKERSVRAFHENHGRNILLSNNNTVAKRTASYNQGIVLSSKHLERGQLFQVKIEKLNPNWSASLLIGVTSQPPEKSSFAVTALGLKKQSWIICGDSVYFNGIKIKSHYGPNLDSLQTRHFVGILIDASNRLHLYVNGLDQGIAAKGIQHPCYTVIDVYGQCEEISVVTSDEPHNCAIETNHREKADLEHEWKEKVSRPPFLESVFVKNCEYQNLCTRFKNSLGLPDGYFLTDFLVCYCETCYTIRGDKAYYRKGDPPKDYAVPFGWCQFSLRMPVKAENSGALDKWHFAFHGTQPAILRRIFDCGELLLPEDAGLCACYRHIPQKKNKSKDNDEETSHIFFSPSIRYAADNSFTPKVEFLDKKSKKRLFARTAIQVLVQPGAYNIGPQRIGAREPIDGHFSNSDIEWFTKEKGANILHSLLIKIEGF